MVELGAQTGVGGPHIAQAAVAALANGTSDEVVVWKNNTGRRVTITQVAYLPDTAVTGDDTNNFILRFKSKTSAGASSKNISDAKTYASGVDMVQFQQDALVLSTTAADLLVDDDQAVTLDKTETGSGLTLPAGLAVITYRFEG